MILLASSSPRRRVLLREAGVCFRVVRPDYVEKTIRGLSPKALVIKHALGKALSVGVYRNAPHQTILAADTVVYFNKKIIGKPKNLSEALRILGKLQGNWHTVWTGAAFVRREKGKVVKKVSFAEKTRVRIRSMTALEIQSYFRKVNPLDKAGAYAIQSKHSIVTELRGSYSNAVGLPMERLRDRLNF